MKDLIQEILSRGVEEVIDKKHLEQKLRRGDKLRVKLGIDPTAKNIHIGRAVVLWKLRDLQDLGHKIVFIVGDFTGLIGDSSDKDSERPMLAKKEVEANMKGYTDQVGEILDLAKAEVRYNSEWLNKLGYLEIAEQADQFSLHEFEARENIAKRMKEGKRVSLREVLYPLMQGYDSVAVKADLEVGGTDQKFNLLAGRVLQKHYHQQPQDLMTFSLLEGTDGRKMSSSWGNVINITDSPGEIFGKTMSIPDQLIVKYLVLCTRAPMDQIEQIKKEMAASRLNPRSAKVRLARELVKMYYSEKEADIAEREFEKIHKDKQSPQNIKEFSLAGRPLIEILVKSGLAKSASDSKRLIDQGGVRVAGTAAKEYSQLISANSVIQVGKRKFIRVK